MIAGEGAERIPRMDGGRRGEQVRERRILPPVPQDRKPREKGGDAFRALGGRAFAEAEHKTPLKSKELEAGHPA